VLPYPPSPRPLAAVLLLAPRRVRARARRVSRREPERVRFRVGQVIRHAQYAYQGVITGWDTSCQSDALWIAQMGVDNLPSPPPSPRGCFHVGGGVSEWSQYKRALPCAAQTAPSSHRVAVQRKRGPQSAAGAHSGPGTLPQTAS
jgi:hypothetical protein